MAATATDVIVVGGGIMGCATALELARRGRAVVLLERGAVGAQASGVNFGNVRTQGRFLPQLPLALRSRRLWDELEASTGERCEFAVHGNLLLAFDAEQMAKAEAYARDAIEWGLALELLGRDAARRRWPWLGAAVHGVSFAAHDGAANPRLVTPALARRARTLGAELRENAEVAACERDGARFRVATCDGAEFVADCLVNTAGAWAGTVAAAFGEDVPLVPSGPQLAVTEPVPYRVEPTVSVVDHRIYFRQVARGNVVFGGGDRGPAHAAPARAEVDPANTLAQLGRVARIAPHLAGSQVIRVWSGVEGYLPDNIPVIGASSRVPGLVHAFGFCGHGFQLGLGVGAVLAELIVDGGSATPIEHFSIDRFSAPPHRAAR